MMTGAERIKKERQRQIKSEGYSAQSDDQYVGPDLINAAIAYATWAAFQIEDNTDGQDEPPFEWPWGQIAWNPSSDPMRNLEKAGALIAAEIDRLERQVK